MLKEIFLKVEKKEDTFNKKEEQIINDLIKEKILIKIDETYAINSKYKIGILKVEKNFAVLCNLGNEYKNIKLDFDNLNGAYNGDLVLAKRIFNPKSQIKAQIIKIYEKNENSILVYVKDNSFISVKESIQLNSKKKINEKNGTVLLIQNKSHEIIKTIGHIDDVKIDEQISLILHNEDYRLNNKIEIDSKMDDTNKRIDLTNLPFCTIDPSSAKDHDDAIYFDKEECILYVAIADVSYFVKQNSTLDKMAYKKSTSIYLPSKVLPMLPNELSEDLCSLKEGINRYAFVSKIYLDKNTFEVLKSEFIEAIIKSHKKFSYGRIDRVLANKNDTYTKIEESIFTYLKDLYTITKKIREKRLQSAYNFESHEHKLKLVNHTLTSVSIEKSTNSHQLIEECMLLANVQASKRLNMLGIYRIHDEPSFQAIAKLVDDVNSLGLKVKLKKNIYDTITHIQKQAKYSSLLEEIDNLIIHAQTQARYSSKKLSHFGLGFASYSHFTSPIRRYADLILHRILKSKKIPKNIIEICEHISNKERDINKLVWDYEDRKYARYASSHIGLEIDIKIIDTQKALAMTYNKISGMKIFIDNYKGQTLFSKQKVLIKSVNIITKKIIASIKY